MEEKEEKHGNYTTKTIKFAWNHQLSTIWKHRWCFDLNGMWWTCPACALFIIKEHFSVKSWTRSSLPMDFFKDNLIKWENMWTTVFVDPDQSDDKKETYASDGCAVNQLSDHVVDNENESAHCTYFDNEKSSLGDQKGPRKSQWF